MSPDFVFIVSYHCPRCHLALEPRASGPPAWLRCPGCNRASLPPEHMQAPPPPEAGPLKGTFLTGPDALPIRPRSMAPMPMAAGQKAPTARLMLGSGFFLTTFLFFFSLLEASIIRSTLLGLAAAVFLFLLTRPAAANRE